MNFDTSISLAAFTKELGGCELPFVIYSVCKSQTVSRNTVVKSGHRNYHLFWDNFKIT